MKYIMATCVRNEGPYILEWLAHYRLLGFTDFYIYSNNNTDGSDELLSELDALNFINWRPRKLGENESPQLSAYKHLCDELFSNESYLDSYLMWIDCDEFIWMRHDNISALLDSYNNPDSLYLNWLHFGSSGKELYSNGITINKFLHCDTKTFHNKLGKCISRIRPELYQYIENHRPVPKDKNNPGRVIYADGLDGEKVLDSIVNGMNPKKIESAPIHHADCFVAHYATRSKQEYLLKSSRGNGRLAVNSAKKQFLDNYFDEHDFTTEISTRLSEKYGASLGMNVEAFPENILAIHRKIVADLFPIPQAKVIQYESMSLKLEFHKLYDLIKNKANGRKIYYVANGGNWGDGLIRHGTYSFFRFYNINVVELTSQQLNTKIKNGMSFNDCVLLYGGGGAWCDKSGGGYNLSKGFSNYFYHVIVLPSTYEKSFIKDNVTMVSRGGKESFDCIRDQKDGPIFCHDMALFLDPINCLKGSGKLYAFRTDNETAADLDNLPEDNIDLSKQGHTYTPLSELFDKIAKYEFIETDRLHITIAAALLGKHVIMRDNSYFKNREVYDSSLKPFFANINFVGRG